MAEEQGWRKFVWAVLIAVATAGSAPWWWPKAEPEPASTMPVPEHQNASVQSLDAQTSREDQTSTVSIAAAQTTAASIAEQARYVLRIGSDADFAGAMHEAGKAERVAGYAASIYYVEESRQYVTTVGQFDSKDAAAEERPKLLERMDWRSNPGAMVWDLRTACKRRTPARPPAGGYPYFVCALPPPR